MRRGASPSCCLTGCSAPRSSRIAPRYAHAHAHAHAHRTQRMHMRMYTAHSAPREQRHGIHAGAPMLGLPTPMSSPLPLLSSYLALYPCGSHPGLAGGLLSSPPLPLPAPPPLLSYPPPPLLPPLAYQSHARALIVGRGASGAAPMGVIGRCRLVRWGAAARVGAAAAWAAAA